MLNKLFAGLGLALGLVACGPNTQISLPDTENMVRIPVEAKSIELREVTLPEYASSQEIYIAASGFSLIESQEAVWADEPSRAITQSIVRNLFRITGARVASDPWPLATPSDAIVEVRFDQIGARTDNIFRIRGQYYISDYVSGDDTARLFSIDERVDATSAADLARAQAAALARLSEEIVRQGL